MLAAIEPLVVGRGEDGEPNGGDDGAERTGGSGLIGSFGAAVDMSEAMDAGIAVRHPRCAVAAPSGVCGGGGVAVAVAVGAPLESRLRSFQRCRPMRGADFSPG